MLSKSMLTLSSVLSSSANAQHNKHASFSSQKKESVGCSLVSSSVFTFVRFTFGGWPSVNKRCRMVLLSFLHASVLGLSCFRLVFVIPTVIHSRRMIDITRSFR